MKKINWCLRNLKNSNEGAAGIVVAILLIGLFLSVIAMVQMVYVPQWMKEKEAEHMDQVANQFLQLKSSVDTLSVSEQKYKMITNPITLGSREMPFFSSNRAYGTLDILPNDYEISIENSEKSVVLSLGSIKYSSQNSYYISQSYTYENGALILSQTGRDLMSIKPGFFVTENNELVLNLVKLSDARQKNTVSGYGTYSLQTRFLSCEKLDIYYAESITILSSHKEAWKQFLYEFLPTDTFDYTITDTVNGDGLILQFSNDSVSDAKLDLPFITVNVYSIEVQISSGWVE